MFPELTCDDVFRIETRRLWLRWPQPADAETIARAAGKPEIAEMTARIPVGMGLDEAAHFVATARAGNTEGAQLTLAITLKGRPEDAIGIIAVHGGPRAWPAFGYWLAQSHWGRGLATEAAQAMVDVFFAVAPLNVLHASVLPYNAASRRVLKKCGFALTGNGLEEAPARGGPRAVDFFRLDRSTWAALKGWREPRFQPLDGRGEVQRPQMEMAVQ